jgi:putative DNA primase/helicase
MMDRLQDQMVGRWRSILPHLGIDPKFLTGKNGPCPMCGGRDRWKWDNKEGRGTFFCSHCGAGDGFNLVMLRNGLDFKAAVERIRPLVGLSQVEKIRAERSTIDKRRAMNDIWRAAWPITLSDPVGLYLRRRCKIETFPKCLRYIERLKYFDDPPRWFPAMVAKVVGPTGKPEILHRTFLTEDGRKAPVDAPRRMMPGVIPKGSAIRLFDPADEMGIAEGIETALSAAMLTRIPVWATLGTSLMTSWVAPQEAKRIVIFGDNDLKFGGHAAAYALAHRLAVSGLDVDVRFPPQMGTDWNDVHMATVTEAA